MSLVLLLSSFGRFDEMRHAEPARRKGKGVRRAFKAVTTEAAAETQGHLKILNSVRERPVFVCSVFLHVLISPSRVVLHNDDIKSRPSLSCDHCDFRKIELTACVAWTVWFGLAGEVWAESYCKYFDLRAHDFTRKKYIYIS